MPKDLLIQQLYEKDIKTYPCDNSPREQDLYLIIRIKLNNPQSVALKMVGQTKSHCFLFLQDLQVKLTPIMRLTIDLFILFVLQFGKFSLISRAMYLGCGVYQ